MGVLDGLEWLEALHFVEKARSQWEDKTIAPRAAVLRQKLSEIESRPVNTVDDYVSNTLETKAVVDEAKGLTQRQMAMIAHFKQAYPDNASDGRMADYMMRLTEKDEQLSSYSPMKSTVRTPSRPTSPNRLAYYDANVPPIKEKRRRS